MESFERIREFFTGMKCSQCQTKFDKDAIKMVREESGYVVIRITCLACNKNIGLAIVGIDKEVAKESLDFTENILGSDEIPFEIEENTNPISYDDVIDAHNFFYSLGSDWVKYIPKEE